MGKPSGGGREGFQRSWVIRTAFLLRKMGFLKASPPGLLPNDFGRFYGFSGQNRQDGKRARGLEA